VVDILNIILLLKRKETLPTSEKAAPVPCDILENVQQKQVLQFSALGGLFEYQKNMRPEFIYDPG